MRFRLRTAFALVAPALLSLAAPALADATIDTDLAVAVSKGRKFTVTADVTMAASGTVTLAGTVGGTEFSLTKKFRTRSDKTRRIKFVVDPRKLGLHDQTDSVILAAAMRAEETGQAEPAIATGGASLPLPLMIVPGLGNELEPAAFTYVYEPFRDALNENAGSPWTTKGSRATIRVQGYPSTELSIVEHGAQIAQQAGKMLKRSKLFARIDMIGQSTGGLVIRQAMVPQAGKNAPESLAGAVRQTFFMGTPQSGAPIAYLAQQALLLTKDLPDGEREATLAAIREALIGSFDSPSAVTLAELLLQPAPHQGATPPYLHVVELFLPTYAFATIPVGEGATAMVDLATLTGLAGTAQIPPLAGLNLVAPDPSTTYHALYYSDVAEATGDVRTIDGVDLVAFILGGGTDLSLIVGINGAGDGVASETSSLMFAHPAWGSALHAVDLGPGLHSVDPPRPEIPAYFNDPNVLGYLLPRLLAGPEVAKQ